MCVCVCVSSIVFKNLCQYPFFSFFLFLITFSISMYIMCVCLFSALSRRVSVLQISVIINTNTHSLCELAVDCSHLHKTPQCMLTLKTVPELSLRPARAAKPPSKLSPNTNTAWEFPQQVRKVALPCIRAVGKPVTQALAKQPIYHPTDPSATLP